MSNKCQDISEYITYGQMNLINTFRNNVMQLVMWSRSFVNAVATDFSGLEAFTEKLYTVPTLFYNSLKPYIGEVDAEEYQNYMFQHILIFTKIVYGLKSGNTEEVDKNIADWYKNADDIATFLAETNLYWEREQWRNLIYQYLEMKIEEAVAIFSGQHRKDIAIYDRLQYHSLIMADYMSRGVIQNLRSLK